MPTDAPPYRHRPGMGRGVGVLRQPVSEGADVDDHGNESEWQRQVARMVAAGYPALAGLSEQAFLDLMEPHRTAVRDLPPPAPPSPSEGYRVRWVIVVSDDLIPAESLVPLLRLPAGDRPGVVDRNYGAEALADYRPLPELGIPGAPAYLLVDVDRGDEFRGVRPRDAVPTILGRGRTPLTIHEGLAVALSHPDSLARNHCYMLAGSRAAHRRVPALWISGNAPKLGWCWEGNHHTWLGIASAARRHSP